MDVFSGTGEYLFSVVHPLDMPESSSDELILVTFQSCRPGRPLVGTCSVFFPTTTLSFGRPTSPYMLSTTITPHFYVLSASRLWSYLDESIAVCHFFGSGGRCLPITSRISSVTNKYSSSSHSFTPRNIFFELPPVVLCKSTQQRGLPSPLPSL